MKREREWAAGPWDSEPEQFDFTDDATGYPIAMRRNNWGAWCGYIGVPNDHALFGKSYSDEVEGAEVDPETKVDEVGIIQVFCHALDSKPTVSILVRCHGGLTYADKAWWEGESRAEWWFGFDCSHSGDEVPAKDMSHGGTYRTLEYVQDCCRKAAADLARFRVIVKPTAVLVQDPAA